MERRSLEEQLIYTTFSPLVIELLADQKEVVHSRGAYFKELRLLETREERAASGKKKPYKGAQKKGDSGKKKKRRKDEPRSLPEIC
ncbi:hypothetical protein KY359_03200, partial [Candidatus Woesearchaeota archaeon]|nr:hypothetical protein [Candidatus Woesearchaeota archaeon]